jgi:hypothetical protein
VTLSSVVALQDHTQRAWRKHENLIAQLTITVNWSVLVNEELDEIGTGGVDGKKVT